MIDVTVMQDASEIIHYDDYRVPFMISKRRLSEYTNMRALCHWHKDIECLYIQSGEMIYEINGKEILLTKGQVLVVNSGQLHFGRDNHGKECEFLLVIFHPDLLKTNEYLYQKYVRPIIRSKSTQYWLFSAKNQGDSSKVTPESDTGEVADQLAGLLSDIVAKKEQKVHALAYHVTADIMQFWTYLYEQNNQEPWEGVQEDPNVTILKEMVSYIHEHYQEPVCLDEIASYAAVSRSKCCRIFQKYLDLSPMAFLNEYRLEVSCNLLQNTSFQITQIALACGFNHLSYYSKIFTQKYGCSPNQYRKTSK